MFRRSFLWWIESFLDSIIYLLSPFGANKLFRIENVFLLAWHFLAGLMIFILYESYVLDQAFVLQSILQAHSIQNLESTQVAPDKVLVYYTV